VCFGFLVLGGRALSVVCDDDGVVHPLLFLLQQGLCVFVMCVVRRCVVCVCVVCLCVCCVARFAERRHIFLQQPKRPTTRPKATHTHTQTTSEETGVPPLFSSVCVCVCV